MEQYAQGLCKPERTGERYKDLMSHINASDTPVPEPEAVVADYDINGMVPEQ